ncbi:EF-hand domain-containing protein [Actibacterium ureilyticum]|uniref:EF-hand domain-containing protein n=1 Tax=Actibacterium ureilyticum TaxID=1590614 RepID=UPI001FE448EA|nr:EF-hand domain-containing protein [Actibacterium ureilyticum]
MKRNTLLAAMALAATALGTAASAESHHGHGGQPGDKGGPGMMQNGGPGMMGNMGGMMDMMARIHGNMMGGGMMGAGMGGGMMQMFDADGDGTTTPDEMRTQLQTKLTEYDSDGDGSLSIAEFEALHSAMIREMMVDRFQHLDADGDGAVTPVEMAAPADRTERMQNMRSNMTDAPARPGNGQGMGDGSMMQGN